MAEIAIDFCWTRRSKSSRLTQDKTKKTPAFVCAASEQARGLTMTAVEFAMSVSRPDLVLQRLGDAQRTPPQTANYRAVHSEKYGKNS